MSYKKFVPTLVAAAAALSFSANASLITNGSFEQGANSDDCIQHLTPDTIASCDQEIIRVADGNNGGWGLFSQLPGWSLLYGNGIELQGRNTIGLGPYDGDFYVELDSHFDVNDPKDSNAGIYQQVSGLTIDQWYELTFAYGIRTNNDNENGLHVFWGEDVSTLINSKVLSKMEHDPVPQWFQVSLTLRATSETMYLGFGAYGHYYREVGPDKLKTENGSGLGALLDNVSLHAVPAPATLGLFGLALVGMLLSRRR